MHKTIDYTDALTWPPKGHVTIGESNSALVHVSGPRDPKLDKFIKKHGELHAVVTMPSRNANIPRHQRIDEALEDFIEQAADAGIIPQPILDKIEEMIKQWDLESIAETAGAAWKKAWDLYNAVKGSYNTIIRKDKLAKLLIRKVAWHPHQTLLAIAIWNDTVWVYDLSIESWYSCGLEHPAQSRITSLEWKPMSGVVLAIGCLKGVALWHVYMDHSPTGTEATWTEHNPLKDRPSQMLSQSYSAPTRALNHGRDTAWLGLSLYERLGGVDQLAWDPRGELLAVASTRSSTVYIRENVTKKNTELRLGFRPTPPRLIQSVDSFVETVSNIKEALSSAVSKDVHNVPTPSHEEGHYGPTVCCLRWSPSGEYLLIAYQSEVARIYDTATWEYTEINDLTGSIQTACWTPNSYNVIYSLQGDDLIRAIHLEKQAGELAWIPMNFVKMSLQYGNIMSYRNAVQREDEDGEHLGLREEFLKMFGGRTLEEISEFGPIEEMTLDPNGERLVVRFRDTDLLGVVLVRPTGSMLRDLDIFMPTGFIQGPGWNGKQVVDQDDDTNGREPKAISMSFASQFNGGSLLMMAWESGRINFMPFYYLSQKVIEAI
ncbi:hypothetical protein BG011_007041 [Mortierella polycephala]|uniref:Anaphase-promoting complex subunit 4-like WD40 domain-containing protein n=1 Tax=Mortierella polycephala TaxID=41804 RepID=A0A9P6PR56_9FUNG|nr:hypothetical protein BG011_007041 [Mortierella polycephala]